MQTFSLHLQHSCVRGRHAFVATGRAVGAQGKSRTVTCFTLQRTLACLGAIGIRLTDQQQAELSAGQIMTFATDEQALRILSLWE